MFVINQIVKYIKDNRYYVIIHLEDGDLHPNRGLGIKIVDIRQATIVAKNEYDRCERENIDYDPNQCLTVKLSELL